jgi:hypothetical protein
MKNTIILGCVSLFLAALFASCNKEEENYRLEVTVTVQDSILAQNALIHFYAPVEGTFIDYYEYTDENGKASIRLLNKAIVEVVASKPPYKGCSFAEIDRDGVSLNLDMKFFNDENNGCRGNQ